MSNPCIPLEFTPVYQPYIWGGRRLATDLHRADVPDGRVAESWEVSDREDGMSVVASGPLQGMSLREVIAQDPSGVMGSRAFTETFPLLIKVLDANRTLSVQVHPNDETAAVYGGEAKTEMWYVLQAEPDAAVYCGFVDGVTPEAFRTAVEEDALEPLLKKIPVQAGEAIFVPGGRVHAIASGCLLLEVQQNSNTTYRIYDWGRVGDDGQPRALHLEQAMQVMRLEDPEEAKVASAPMPPLAGMPREQVMVSDYFVLQRLFLTGQAELPSCPESFQVLFSLEGGLSVTAADETVTVPAGRSVLVPAAATGVTLQSRDATASIMRISLPAGSSSDRSES
jgi:mannose-6-phosphate isomerase